jgi:hypothetical protein
MQFTLEREVPTVIWIISEILFLSVICSLVFPYDKPMKLAFASTYLRIAALESYRLFPDSRLGSTIVGYSQALLTLIMKPHGGAGILSAA